MRSLFFLLGVLFAIPSLAGPNQSTHCNAHSYAGPPAPPLPLPAPVYPRLSVQTLKPPSASLPLNSPGPNKSEQAVQELHKSYSDFLALSREQLIADVENLSKQFISKATRILFRYPEHLPVSKAKFNAETRRAYKVLFGSVIYIVNPHDPEILGYLVGDGRLTQEELAQMDLIRRSPRQGLGMLAAFAQLDPSASSPSSVASVETQEAWRNIARRFIEDL